MPFVAERLGLEGDIAEEAADLLLRVRETARRSSEFVVADAIRAQLGARSVHVEDHADGSSSWSREMPRRIGEGGDEGKEVRRLAREALDASVGAKSLATASEAVRPLAAQVLERLTAPSEAGHALQGRQFADVAMSLAMAGADEPELFQLLARGAAAELNRTGARTPPLVVAQMIERCALAGLRHEDCPQLFEAAADLVCQGELASSGTARDLRAGNLSLFSARPLLWLFRHALRQGDRGAPPEDASVAHEAIASLNGDGEAGSGAPAPSRGGLVLDLGCGFGISSLGMAMSGYRVFAADASAHCVNFARSLARRWGLPPSSLRLEHCGAVAALGATLLDFRGPVEWILVNFPTPFAAAAAEGERPGGNSQLPPSVASPAFMANVKLLEKAREVLVARAGASGPGTLLLQSNCEDVAVTLRDMAEASGWFAVTDGSLGPHVAAPRGEGADAPSWLPRRQLSYASAGGRRAAGEGWLAASPLPREAATETERYYEGEGLPVHRLALRPRL